VHGRWSGRRGRVGRRAHQKDVAADRAPRLHASPRHLGGIDAIHGFT
jgi:hypothetical protein